MRRTLLMALVLVFAVAIGDPQASRGQIPELPRAHLLSRRSRRPTESESQFGAARRGCGRLAGCAGIAANRSDSGVARHRGGAFRPMLRRNPPPSAPTGPRRHNRSNSISRRDLSTGDRFLFAPDRLAGGVENPRARWHARLHLAARFMTCPKRARAERDSAIQGRDAARRRSETLFAKTSTRCRKRTSPLRRQDPEAVTADQIVTCGVSAQGGLAKGLAEKLATMLPPTARSPRWSSRTRW